ncbi:hypothetical protein KL929_000734 [Ogataea haglerorum]|nr:hypothetical protein KL951_000387 [Ogataea haglerorum]KAG7799818.1 hypothetical protein KL929_000734 [Ogataea haglerorum]
MSLGTLYAGEATRVLAAKGVVKALDLDVKFGEKTDEAFQKNFPLGKVPAFIGPRGYKLNEAIAVLYYCEYLRMRTMIDAFMMKYFHQLYSYPCLKYDVEITNLRCIWSVFLCENLTNLSSGVFER